MRTHKECHVDVNELTSRMGEGKVADQSFELFVIDTFEGRLAAEDEAVVGDHDTFRHACRTTCVD